MKLYNTASRKVEKIDNDNAKVLSFYSCGPTVYDFPHIGNWYTFIRYDTLNRVLNTSGHKTKWVMNITDVGHLVSDADEGEDKLEKGAKRENSSAWEIAEKYTNYFTLALKRLNISSPDILPKATDHINEQIELIKSLESKGHTYVIDDGVYFDTSTFPKYGEMARLNLSKQKEGARVEKNTQKRNPYDFALWKFSPKGVNRDMEWDSPWGKGFPGWHLECSAMSMKYLGPTIDIHGGGIDHIPVHHTNEIAQSEGATGKKFVKCWFHSNFNLVDGKKMSKSSGSFITLDDIEKKGFELLAFRLLVLQSHYRTEAHFSWENLDSAQNRLNELRAWADLRYQPTRSKTRSEIYKLLKQTEKEILELLENDLNTPEALAALGKLIKYMQTNLMREDERKQFGKMLEFLDAVFGLDLAYRPDITFEQKELLSSRQKAREEKKWDQSDKIRKTLEDQAIEVKDTKHGQIWSRK